MKVQARLAPMPATRRPAAARPEAPTDKVELSNLVDVKHTRELRGAWVASVWNINFPSKPGLPVDQQKKEMRTMLDRLQQSGFNSVFFHVRPEGDALYKGGLEPASHYLTGTPGKDPGYDPLAFMIEEAHQRNLEVHAWLNPYRAASSLSTQQVAPHLAVTNPEHVHPYGSVKWMDPGAKVVQQRLVDVCADLTKRYDVDGIHFDDYFYPYPIDGKEFPDQRTFQAYQAEGGKLNKADWRRDNVNRAVRDVSQAVAAEKDHVRFGISPFGIPAPDKPEGISGFNQYEGLYADPQKWMDEGWVDYLAPQLYWRTDQPKQAYGTLIQWWGEHASGGRYIFGGNDLTSLGKNAQWNVNEYRKEVALTRQHADGNLWWNVGPLLENRQNIADVCAQEFYAKPALTPPLANAGERKVAPPQVEQSEGKVRLQAGDQSPLRAWTVYRQDGEGWALDRIIPGTQSELTLPRGQWALAAASKHGVESQGVVVTVS